MSQDLLSLLVGSCLKAVDSSFPGAFLLLSHIQACESHDHDHEWTDYATV